MHEVFFTQSHPSCKPFLNLSLFVFSYALTFSFTTPFVFFVHTFICSFFTTNTHNLTLLSSLPTNTRNFIFLLLSHIEHTMVLESSFKIHKLNKFCKQHKLRAKFRWPQVLMQKVMWSPTKSFCKHLVPNFSFWPLFWWNLGFWCHVS
jgi:hypothetical protein